MAKAAAAKTWSLAVAGGRRYSDPAAVPAVPENTIAPVVTGTPTVGETLSCTTGTWDNGPDSYAYQWLRAGAPISGAAASTYDLVEDDGFAEISCEVTATNEIGSTAAESNAVGPVEPAGEATIPYDLPLLFSDDFETGNLNHTENGIAWEGGAFTSVSTQNANGGTRSLRFAFSGTGAGGEATSEQRFSIETPLLEMLVEFDLYYPDGSESYGGAAYTIRESSGNNNKFIRLWRGDKTDGNDGYSDHYFKTGAENRPGSGGIANIYPSYGVDGGGIGPSGSTGTGPTFTTNGFVTADMLGSWHKIWFYSKCATALEGGIIRVYKNEVLIGEVEDIDIYPSGGASQNGVDFGYLLGYANSGFSAQTLLFIDNVKIYGTS
jgi:hypothetical protein